MVKVTARGIIAIFTVLTLALIGLGSIILVIAFGPQLTMSSPVFSISLTMAFVLGFMAAMATPN